MYQTGLGVAQDHAQAASWFRKAGDKGHIGAQSTLGLMHETDLGNGPRLEWNVRKDVQIWAALLRGNILNTDDIVVEKKLTALLAVNFSF